MLLYEFYLKLIDQFKKLNFKQKAKLIFIVVVCTFFISLFTYINITERELKKHGVTTVAPITKVYKRKSKPFVRYKFNINTKEYTGSKPINNNHNFEVGEKYLIIYLPRDPNANNFVLDEAGDYVKVKQK